jgi:hypothetical protein
MFERHQSQITTFAPRHDRVNKQFQSYIIEHVPYIIESRLVSPRFNDCHVANGGVVVVVEGRLALKETERESQPKNAQGTMLSLLRGN